MVFWGGKILSLKWADKNILLALSALKNIVFVEKNSAALRNEKNILTPKKPIAPHPPFKLNGCPLRRYNPQR